MLLLVIYTEYLNGILETQNKHEFLHHQFALKKYYFLSPFKLSPDPVEELANHPDAKCYKVYYIPGGYSEKHVRFENQHIYYKRDKWLDNETWFEFGVPESLQAL